MDSSEGVRDKGRSEGSSREAEIKAVRRRTGDGSLHVEVRVRCSRCSEKEGVRSQRAGDSHAWSATKRGER